ncbi:MAG: hypothetical protein KJ601_00075 [Nanoarchaeota archaeon]|nr:hypothetical protein [Nanoarchaeota archaeon]MBU1703855.1 hypothetical protein [Nanoarchaeota archaeon]
MKNLSKGYRIGPYTTSQTELRDLTKAWVCISLAFGILLSGFSLSSRGWDIVALLMSFIVAAITVGIGFIVHELSHKIIAQRYGCQAEFRAFDNFLIIGIFMALFLRILIAAPGAVMISGPVGKSRNGKISMAGPTSNLAVALGFLAVAVIFGHNIITYYGFFINSLLAGFNMLPVAMFDGRKIFEWNKAVWGILAVVAAVFVFISYNIPV